MLQLPVSSEAHGALGAFCAGELGAVCLAIDGEAIALRAVAPPRTGSAALRAALPNEACFVLYRWCHTHADGGEKEATLLLFMRPEEANMRAKMLHASACRPLVQRLQAEYAVTVARVAEGLELDEVHDKELHAQLYVYE